MDCVAIDNEWEGFPYTSISAGGKVCHGFSSWGLEGPQNCGRESGRRKKRNNRSETEVRWKKMGAGYEGEFGRVQDEYIVSESGLEEM